MAMSSQRFMTLKPQRRSGLFRRLQQSSRCKVQQDVKDRIQNQTIQSTQKFDWTRQWYPVIPSAYLDDSKPSAFQLLGLNLVLWKAADGRWSCLEDACSHRLAALSEGYIQPETRTLMCSYHGWEFNGSGDCVKIPQIDPNDAAHQTACCSRKSKVKSFPVRQAWGLTWVWPESGQDAETESAAAELPLPEVVKNAKPGDLSYFSSEAGWTMREADISYESLVENILDLSHVPFLHHRVQGTRENAIPNPMKLVSPIESDTGFRAECTPHDKDIANSVTHIQLIFQPPNMVTYVNTMASGGARYLTAYTTPCGPSKSRYFSRIFTDSSAKIPGFLTKLPVAFIHLAAHAIVDADIVLAATQQKALATKGLLASSAGAFYMPAPADRGVSAFYTWLNKFSGGSVGYVTGEHKLKVVTRQEALDRYKSHTSTCKFCQDALKLLDTMKHVLVAVAIAAVIGLAFVLSGKPYPVLVTSQLGVAGIAAFLLNQVEQFKGKFYYENYTFHDRV